MGIAVIYAAYLAVSIGLTVIVAAALSRSGRVYLAGVFGGDEGMAVAVNRMMVVGFCLLSLGYAALTMRTSGDIHGAGEALGVLSVKVGEELLVLGALHLVNMMIFTRLRRRQEAGGRPGGPGLGGRPGGARPGGRPGGAGIGRPDADWPGATEALEPAPARAAWPIATEPAAPSAGTAWPAATTAAGALH
jgi:hypothetical protein